MGVQDYLSTENYLDAKNFYGEAVRSYAGTLPRMSFWQMRDLSTTQFNSWTTTEDATAGQKRRQIFDTGFYNLHFPDAASQSIGNADVDGYTDVADYLQSTHVPYVIRVIHYAFHLFGQDVDSHPCYDGVSGLHIGEQHTCGVGVNFTADSSMRFQDTGGTPLAGPPIGEDNFLFPFLDDNVSILQAAARWTYDNNNLYGQSIIDALDNAGVNILEYPPVGFVLDYEDFPHQWRQPGLEEYYTDDPRFAFDTGTTRSLDYVFRNYVGQCVEGVEEALLEKTTYATEDNIYRYFSGEITIHPGTDKDNILSTIFGRPKGTLSFYPYSSGIPLDRVFSGFGKKLAQFASVDIHCFTFWTAASINFPRLGFFGDFTETNFPDQPGIADTGEGQLTVAQHYGVVRMGMCLGGAQICIYNSTYGSSHDLWTNIVAYDSIQNDANVVNIIKNGKNFIPPFDRGRKWTDSDGTEYPFISTVWYNLDANENTIDSNIYIACRVYNETMLVVAIKTNETGDETTSSDVTIILPNNQEITVTATPWCSITVV